MWDEDDHFGRWAQGICAIFLALFAAVDAYMFFSGFFLIFYGIAAIILFFASLRYCWRCAKYALTGKGNVNRDEY